MTYPARKPKKSQKTKLNQSRKRNAGGEGNHIRPQKFSLAPRTPTPFLFPLTVLAANAGDEFRGTTRSAEGCQTAPIRRCICPQDG
jgi:hypothetical protein